MTRTALFDLATAGVYLLPLSLALAVVMLPRPKSAIARAAVAVITSWVASVFYAIHVYNSAGIAAGQELGWASPEMRFDNNTVAVQLMMGWLVPAVAVTLFFVIRRRWLSLAREQRQ